MEHTAHDTLALSREELRDLVLDGLDREQAGARYGIRRWDADFECTLRERDEEDLRHVFHAPEVRDAMVGYFRADIAENEAIYRFQVARNAKRAARLRLEVALGEHDGVFVEEDAGDEIVPELQGVTRVSKQARVAKLRRVVEASARLAERPEEPEAEGLWFPPSLGEGVEDFARDLSEILKVGGEKARSLVLRVCNDIDIAKRVESDPDMPKPLRYLAGIVAKTWAEISTPLTCRQIGFSTPPPSA